MRLLSHEDGDLSSYFEEIDESEEGINNSSLKLMLVDSQTENDKKGKMKADIPLKYIISFCRTLKKFTKGIGFELQLETSSEKEDIVYTTIGGNDGNVTINSFYL